MYYIVLYCDLDIYYFNIIEYLINYSKLLFYFTEISLFNNIVLYIK